MINTRAAFARVEGTLRAKSISPLDVAPLAWMLGTMSPFAAYARCYYPTAYQVLVICAATARTIESVPTSRSGVCRLSRAVSSEELDPPRF